MKKTSALSTSTAALIERLDRVLDENPAPNSPEENGLMFEHVRLALQPGNDNEPMFTENELKLAFVELLQIDKESA